MNIHNILEDQVLVCVNDTYKRTKELNAPWLTCDCEQCRLDTAAYVLNKLPPRYVVSGRGLTHMLARDDAQSSIDMDALVIEGMRKIAANVRPFHAEYVSGSEKQEEGPAFNFPVFLGTVLDGTTLQPVREAEVKLSCNGKVCSMLDHTWGNPTSLNVHTNGKYGFWPKHEKAHTTGETKHFQFKIEITADGFEKTLYTLEVPVDSCEHVIREPNTVKSLKIQDLYLFKIQAE